MSDLAAEIARKFIARRDVFAEQYEVQDKILWSPVLEYKDGPRRAIKMQDLDDHLSGKRSFGHYLLNTDSQCKLFAFDIDLEKSGTWVETPDLTNEATWIVNVEDDLRGAWLNRSHPGRDFLKRQMVTLASLIASHAKRELDLPIAVSYSGGKGVHVYCFTGLIPAKDAREGAKIILDAAGSFAPLRGDNFFKSTDADHYTGFQNFSIEVFPKQDGLEGKDLGNLMRLPGGRNKKSPDPAFFMDLTEYGVMRPAADQLEILTSGSPWRTDV